MNDRTRDTLPAPGDRGWWTRPLRALFWLTLMAVLVICSLPQPPLPPVPTSDKVQHAAAFLCLTLLGAAAYPRLSLVKLAIGLAAFGALIEAVQSIPALNRDAEFLDWVADAGGMIAALALLLAWHLLRRKH